MRFIGDIHGEFAKYRQALIGVEESIQVGDYGLGFGNDHRAPTPEPGHRFIRGNHDNPAVCARQPNWISDGLVEKRGDNTIMYIGGAWSIDGAYRRSLEAQHGVTWWAEEELPHAELYRLTDIFNEVQPTLMVTHDCPAQIQRELFPHYTEHYQSRTQIAFDAMFANHKPRMWIFGHHHQSIRRVIDGTHFICLNVHETMDIDL